MELKDFISFRKKIQNHETTGFGFKGDMKSINSDDAELLKLFDLGEVREVYYLSNNTDVDFENAVLGQDVCIAIDLSFFRSYYETFQDFIRSNKTHFPADPFYIHEFEYLHGENELISQIRNFITISDILSFISSLSKHEINSYGTLELIFQKPDDVRSIKIDYDVDAIENLNIRTSVKELEDHVFEDPGQETKKRMFSNEMINVLSKKECSFNCLLNAWDKINQSYKNSYENYLADFSFEKIKTSSHEHFHELTDRIYSTINKFSTYILAIPIAYIFILRFFDFDGKSCPKDSFLLVVGILYYLVIRFALLSNLTKAFNTIENDITKFQERINNEGSLSEIFQSLSDQKDKAIPSQRRKILLVKIISLIILLIILGAYFYIHGEYFIEIVKSKLW